MINKKLSVEIEWNLLNKILKYIFNF